MVSTYLLKRKVLRISRRCLLLYLCEQYRKPVHWWFPIPNNSYSFFRVPPTPSGEYLVESRSVFLLAGSYVIRVSTCYSRLSRPRVGLAGCLVLQRGSGITFGSQRPDSAFG